MTNNKLNLNNSRLCTKAQSVITR